MIQIDLRIFFTCVVQPGFTWMAQPANQLPRQRCWQGQSNKEAMMSCWKLQGYVIWGSFFSQQHSNKKHNIYIIRSNTRTTRTNKRNNMNKNNNNHKQVHILHLAPTPQNNELGGLIWGTGDRSWEQVNKQRVRGINNSYGWVLWRVSWNIVVHGFAFCGFL